MKYGPEIIINGDFSNGATAWSLTATVVTNEVAVSTIVGGAITVIRPTTLLVYEVGEQYTVWLDVIGDVGNNIKILDAGANNGGLIADDTRTTLTGSLQNLEFTFTANANSNLIQITRDTTSGDWVFNTDNISLKKILPTTTVEVTWIDSLSAAATGNKIYRDDVEIADIAMGVQIYQDTTAETGTEYKYEVQAYSATDETTQEVLGANVQYITTA